MVCHRSVCASSFARGKLLSRCVHVNVQNEDCNNDDADDDDDYEDNDNDNDKNDDDGDFVECVSESAVD